MITNLYSQKNRSGKHVRPASEMMPLTPDTRKHAALVPVAVAPEPSPDERYAAFHTYGSTR